MKVWTAHTRPGGAALLVREGFSWGAALFGPFWLAAHRAWIAAAFALAAWGVLGAVAAGPAASVLALGLMWIQGLVGNDLRRWALERRGFTLAHVIAARNGDAAIARLLDRRPDLIADTLG